MKLILSLLFGFALTAQSALAFSSSQKDKFKKGDRVLTSDNKTGYIKKIFKKRALIDVDRTHIDYTANISSLAKKVNCFRKFCKNKRVMTPKNDTGYIKEIFDNGKAIVDYDGIVLEQTWKTSKLGLSYKCSGKLCVKAKILTPDNHVGYVQEIFDNGLAIIDYNGTSLDYVWKIRTLGYRLDYHNKKEKRD